MLHLSFGEILSGALSPEAFIYVVTASRTPTSIVVIPPVSRLKGGKQEANALVVRRVEPQHPFENDRRLLVAVEPPKAEKEPVHAAESP